MTLRPPAPLDPSRHCTDEFDCDVERLDTWLRAYAGREQKRDASRTFVVADGGDRVVGFYTLVAAQLDPRGRDRRRIGQDLAVTVDEHAERLADLMVPVKRARHRATVARPDWPLGLDHFAGFDPRWVRAVGDGEVVAALRSLEVPTTAVLLSADGALHGRELPLAECFEQVYDSYSGTVISCVPGRIAVFRDEAPADPILLVRPQRR